MTWSSAPFGLATDVPVDPDAPEARDLLIDELSKPVYQSSQPNWIDQLTSAFWDWLASLQFGEATGPPALGLAVVVALVIAAVVIAFFVFGIPRLNRKSRTSGMLFGENDERTAADMRRAAQDAAERSDFALAVAEMFRAIARGLAERTIVTTNPGTTAREFSIRASAAFPDRATELSVAAIAFDEVRYLGREGTREQYDQVASLERALSSARVTEGVRS